MEPAWKADQAYVGLTATCPVRVERKAERPNGGLVEPHTHTYYEVTLITEGRGIHCTPSFEAEVSMGSVLVVAPGAVHALREWRTPVRMNVYYLAEWMLDDLRALSSQAGLVPLFFAVHLFRRPEFCQAFQFQLSDGELSKCVRELSDIAEECSLATPSLLFLRSALLKYLTLLSRAYLRARCAPQEPHFHSQVWQALEHVERVILQCTPFCVETLAEELAWSSRHFARVFKDETGWSPADYYQFRRIQYAGRLLLNPERSVTEVAHQLGFCDSAHFCHVFKLHNGISPAAYRALYRIESQA